VINDHEFSGYMDGELEPDRAEVVERALANDPRIAAKLDRLRVVDRLLSERASSIASEISTAAIPIQNSGHGRNGRFRTRSGAAAIVLIMVVAKIVIGFLEPWISSGLELTLLASLLALACRRFHSMAAMADEDFARIVGTAGQPE